MWDSPEEPDIQVVWIAPGSVPAGRPDDAVRCALKPAWTVFAGQPFLKEHGRTVREWRDLVHCPALSVHAYSYFPQPGAMGPWLDLIQGRVAMEADWSNALEGPAVNGGGLVVLPAFAQTYSDRLRPVEVTNHPRFGLELWMAASAEALRSPPVRTTFDALYAGLTALRDIRLPWLT